MDSGITSTDGKQIARDQGDCNTISKRSESSQNQLYNLRKRLGLSHADLEEENDVQKLHNVPVCTKQVENFYDENEEFDKLSGS